ncbi:MAG: gluconokinase [Intrasporangiaceae bacterium]|nr:gluconokinase [Intrasporangiaceae bacterium]
MVTQRASGADQDERTTASHVVVMGVSGSGKSTIAAGLALRSGRALCEGDDMHPPENIAKMAAGIALTDADRRPWLQRLADWIAEHDETGRSTVLACSALTRAYRDVLRGGADKVRFVHLTGPAEVLAERMGDREGHFMPGSLLRSQLDTLEALGPDEDGIVLDVRLDPDDLVDAALEWVR